MMVLTREVVDTACGPLVIGLYVMGSAPRKGRPLAGATLTVSPDWLPSVSASKIASPCMCAVAGVTFARPTACPPAGSALLTQVPTARELDVHRLSDFARRAYHHPHERRRATGAGTLPVPESSGDSVVISTVFSTAIRQNAAGGSAPCSPGSLERLRPPREVIEEDLARGAGARVFGLPARAEGVTDEAARKMPRSERLDG